jgi:hypothetical protein
MLGRTLYERARMARGQARRAQRDAYLERARQAFEQVLTQDPENLTAHANLALVYTELGDPQLAEHHRRLQLTYRSDEDAVARAVAQHRRRNPAADHASEPVAVYDLQRPGAYGLPERTEVADDPPNAARRDRLTQRKEAGRATRG